MESPLRKKINSIMKDHKKRQMWYRIVTSLAVVVVFITTYMLILPAITMENKAECGITEHKHDANCYATHYETEKVLACTTESLGVHKHTDACYNAEHKLICGYADFVIHQHDASCYDADGTLVCAIPEHKLHEHTESCYQMQKQLVCTQEEYAGHTHTAECYTKEKGDLVCTQEEHTHGEGCYDEDGNLVCEKEEHVHGDECYQWNDVLTCTQEESAGHQHGDACYQDVKVLICEEPAELHTHTDACYKDGVLACGKVELKEHKHDDSCYKENQVLVETLVCDRVEHVHTDECYKGSKSGETSEDASSEEGSSEVVSSEAESEEALSEEESTSVEEVSSEFESEEVSSEEISSEEASSEEVSAEEISTEEVSTEEFTSEEASSEEESTEELSSEEASTEEITSEAETEEESSEEESSEAESEEAVEKEDQSTEEIPNEPSWCIVHSIAVPTNNQINNMADSIALFNDDTEVKLDSYITSIIIQKIENGNWTNIGSSGLKEGDKVKVDIKYAIENGLPDGKNTLVYELPKNLKINKEMSGSVIQDGRSVGTYTISTDGKITIVIDKSKFNPSESFTGDVGFEGSAEMTTDDDSEEIKFPGKSESITINKDKSKYDLTVEKEAKLSADYKTIDYTVTVSSKTGTSDEKITIIDKFSGDATGKYQEDSFKLVKIDSDGNEVEMSQKPTIITENGNQTFSYKDLPALEKNECYKVTYKADVIPNAKGGGTVSNAAGAKTPSKDKWDSEDVKIPGSMISKSGVVVHWPKKLIKWTIVVNEDEIADVGGYTLSDNLPGTLDEEKGIVIDPALPDGSTKITKFPFTFPSGAGNKKYTIVYYTLPPTTAGKVENTASIEKDGKKNDSTGSVDYWPRGESLNKSFEGDGKDYDKDILYWSSTINLSEDYQNEIVFADTILDTIDKKGQTVIDIAGKNPHYAIASKLKETLMSGDNIKLELENSSKLNYSQAVEAGYQFEFKFYEAKDSIEIDNNDTTAHVGYFEVKVSRNDKSFQAKSLTLKYFTYADYSSMPEGDKWTLKNQAKYHDKISEAKTDYGDTSSLKKECGVRKSESEGINYSTPSTVKYNESDGYLYYRLILTTSSEQNQDLTITDELSDSGMTYDIDYFDVKFAKNDKLETKDKWEVWNDSGKSYSYDLNGAQKPIIKVDGQKATIIIKGGYNKGKIDEKDVYDGIEKNHTFVITYRVKFADDPYWDDLKQTSKVYGNTVVWGKLKDSTETIVDERIIDNMEKTGKQRLATDADGNVIYDKDGKPTYLEVVDYQIVINPKGEDLVEGSNTITLTDRLKVQNQNVKAYLEMDSVKLYQYDMSTEDHLGKLIDRSMYKLSYDDSDANAPIMTVDLPDEMPCILVYTYSFDKASVAGSYKVNNTAELSGQNQSHKEVEVVEDSSYANIDQSELSIYKVDEDDQSVRLGNAKFKLEEYSEENKKWSTVSYANPMENGGRKEGSGDNTLYVTCDDGYLRFDRYNGSGDNAANGLLKINTIYRLTEVVPPAGYELNKTPRYFVLFGDGKMAADFEEQMRLLAENGKTYYFKAGIKVAINVTDKFAGISVRKVWQDENGAVQTSGMPDSIQVQLYRKKTQLDVRTVTVTFGSEPKRYKVKPGSMFTLRVIGWWNDNVKVICNGQERSYVYNNNGNISCDVGIINEDTEIQVTAGWYQGKLDPIYTSATYIVDDEATKELVGTAVLSAENNWEYTWTNEDGKLLAVDENGAPYYYFVEEVGVPSGYTVSYTNNNGITVGGNEMVITNRAEKQPITLPETGGIGTYWYTLGGLLLIAGAALLMYINFVRKGGKRI